jgi:hypothetical protein
MRHQKSSSVHFYQFHQNLGYFVQLHFLLLLYNDAGYTWQKVMICHYTSGSFRLQSANCAGTIYIYRLSTYNNNRKTQKRDDMYPVRWCAVSTSASYNIPGDTAHYNNKSFIYVESDIAYILLLFYTNTVTATVIFPLIWWPCVLFII